MDKIDGRIASQLLTENVELLPEIDGSWIKPPACANIKKNSKAL